MSRVCLLLVLCAASPAWAQTGVDVEEHLGQKIPLDLEFTGSGGARVRLGDLLDSRKPLLLVLAYDRCPALCGLLLRGVASALSRLDWEPGREYQVATVSIDPRETSDVATRRQARMLELLGRGDAAAWPFLVGSEPDIQALAAALGFRYRYDPGTNEYAHPAVIFVLAPDGTISRYLYGIEPAARDLKLALLEASQGRTGSFGDRVLLACFRYDPATRRYGLFVARFMRIGAGAVLVIVFSALLVLWRKEQRGARP